MFVFKRVVTQRQFSPNLLNGVRFFIRLCIIIVAFSTFIGVSGGLIPGGIPVEIALLVSTAVGTIFALSTTTVMQNFVAGIYIIITKPFIIGDFVRINTYEGIVEEISLNNTKLRLRSGSLFFISNQTIIGSKIVNFSLSPEEHEEVPRKAKKFKDELKGRVVSLTKYVFTIDLPKDKPERTKQAFVDVAEEFKDVFKEPPRFITTAYTSMVTVSIILVADDSEVILKNKDGVVEALYKHIFK
jgi:hypothetical protein